MLPALCIALATRLATDGVVRENGVLPAALAADVRAVALAAAVPSAQRQEVPLSLKSNAVASAAAAVAASPVGRALEDLCGGDAPLFDLCAVVSAPGAPTQPLHSDLGFDGAAAAPLYTCFVALQETPSALGPTEFCVGSHTDADAHNALRKGALPREAVAFPLAVGAAVLFDPRIAHRGGPNSSNRRRAYLSMTFANPRGSAPVIVPAPGDVLVSDGGISADGGGIWTLRDLRNML
jgi:hypothetical protein